MPFWNPGIFPTVPLFQLQILLVCINMLSFIRSLEALDEDALKELSIYYRNNVPKMQCRIITPFSDAPSDVEFHQSTEIPWIGKKFVCLVSII
jgi:hypothetical protein